MVCLLALKAVGLNICIANIIIIIISIIIISSSNSSGSSSAASKQNATAYIYFEVDLKQHRGLSLRLWLQTCFNDQTMINIINNG